MNIWPLWLNKARKQPYFILPGLYSLLNGYLHRLLFIIMRKHIHIGKGFRVYGRFRVIGPGNLSIGNYCMFDSRLLGDVVFYLDTPNATVNIGHQVTMHGTKLQCYQKITIDDWCSLADAYITDSQGHHLSIDRRKVDSATVPTSTVTIQKNVWVSTKVVILHGTLIGENSVIGACSLVKSHEILPSNGFFAGIPVRCIHSKIPESHA